MLTPPWPEICGLLLEQMVASVQNASNSNRVPNLLFTTRLYVTAPVYFLVFFSSVSLFSVMHEDVCKCLKY